MAYIYYLCVMEKLQQKEGRWRCESRRWDRIAVPLASISDEWRHQCLLLSLALLLSYRPCKCQSVQLCGSVESTKLPWCLIERLPAHVTSVEHYSSEHNSRHFPASVSLREAAVTGGVRPRHLETWRVFDRSTLVCMPSIKLNEAAIEQ